MRRAERSALWDRIVWHAKVVGSFGVDSIAPPCLNVVQANRTTLRILQGKEDEEAADGITGVQTSGQNIYRSQARGQKPWASTGVEKT